MKYFSISSVEEAYREISVTTKEKFWGILGILHSVDETVYPNKYYNVETKKLSQYFEDLFRLDDKKVYSGTDEYSFIFSTHWVDIVSLDYLGGRPNIIPIIVWAYRNHPFQAEISAAELFNKFLKDYHITKETAEQLFNITFSNPLSFDDSGYSDSVLLSRLGGSLSSGKSTIKLGGEFVVANPGDLSRGPYFQPLYAALQTLKCLTIYPFNIHDYYDPVDNDNQECDNGIHEDEVDYVSRQVIYYGAPGTGKSKTIKDKTEEAEKEGRLFRTTFHPDSDYSTFVGCYKPTKVKSFKQPRMDMSLDDLAKALGSYYKNEELGKIGGLQQFCLEYYPYIDGEYMSVNVTKLIELAGVPKDYNVEVNKYIKFIHLLPRHDPDKITYEFIPQAFTNAYVKAWNTKEDVYLIIEEINRGNCAQIFGDLFQLLDRKSGFSEYPIDADSDLGDYICEELKGSTRTDFPEGVKEGKKLVLPENLYIWATMNTSDQSLFPIDSAFKRRWDWKYMKIRNHPEENYKIKLSDKEYDWWEFIQRINEIIASMTSSADKQLGYFFCKATEGNNISPDTFVSKVIFYLWNDVFKDYGFEDESLFSYKEVVEGKEERKELTFPDFYDEDGEKVNEVRLKGFLDSVMNWKKDEESK